MPEPADGMVPSDPSHEWAPLPSPLASSGEARLVPGQRWRTFQIEAPLPGGGAHAFLAEHLSLMEKVVIHARPLSAAVEWRRGAWERLSAMTDQPIVACLEAYEEDGWRYEVTQTPPPTSLREWIANNPATPREIELLVRDLARALGAMHAQGVVHLGIRPETVFVQENGASLEFVLGGLEYATLYTQPELMPAEVDPFYAPPEAAGLAYHQPGTGLCAWDWWSVGRTAQEFLLGRHVLGLVLDRDVSRVTPELRGRAERLLLEREPPDQRAGAVEFMPTMDTATTALFRGLLSSALEARWSSNAVQRWLRHETVREHYDLPRTARLWVWKTRSFTLPEAADYFTQDEPWEDGEHTLFNPQEADSLAAFLRDTPAYHKESKLLLSVLEMAEMSAWEAVPGAALRTAIASAAWLALGNSHGGKAVFRVRDHIVDPAGLLDLLTAPGTIEGSALVNAFLATPFIQFVEGYDATAGRALRTLNSIGGESVRYSIKHGWLDPTDNDGHTRMFTLALQPGERLRNQLLKLRATYATSSDPELARLMHVETPATWELVTLAYTFESAERCGYVTHEEWSRRRHAELKTEGERIGRGLFWRRLARLLRLAWPWGAAWPVFGGVMAAAAGLVGGLLRAPFLSIGLLAVLWGSRFGLAWCLQRVIAAVEPGLGPWTWRDGRLRCELELVRFPAETKRSVAALTERLGQISAELAKLHPADPARNRLPRPAWGELLAGAGGWLLVVGLILYQAATYTPPAAAPPASDAAVAAATAKILANAAAATADPAAPKTPEQLLASGEYEVVDDGFGRRLRGPLKKWDLSAPANPPAPPIAARVPASAEQTAFALVSGTLQLDPYPRKAVSAYLAVRVPTQKGFGLLVFNTRDRVLVDREVRVLDEPLTERSWYQLGAQRVVYLGTPPVLEPEISLAPR